MMCDEIVNIDLACLLMQMDKCSSSSAYAHFTVSDWPVTQMQHFN